MIPGYWSIAYVFLIIGGMVAADANGHSGNLAFMGGCLLFLLARREREGSHS